MDEHIAILVITIVVLGYGYISAFLAKINISGPMVFTTVGLLLSSLVFGVVDSKPNSEFITITTEIALIIVLFSDASSLNLKQLQWELPVRLLFIGLPLTIVFATIVGILIFPQENILYILLLALLLAPTDAALGKIVVSDKKIPLKIRSAINVESGLNDGIVFPILLGVIVAITHKQEDVGLIHLFLYVGKEIIIGAIVGAIIGYLNAKISLFLMSKKEVKAAYKNLLPLAIAILAYYAAEGFGGNGFIAAFFGGLFFGNFNERLKINVDNFAESESELLLLIVFMVFGFTFIPATIAFWNIKVLLYAILSLTFLRIVPVAVSLIGTKLDMASVLFIGWFGPRGIASVLYILIVVHQVVNIKGHEIIYSVATLTILMSIFLHGLSAEPLVKLYNKSYMRGSK